MTRDTLLLLEGFANFGGKDFLFGGKEEAIEEVDALGESPIEAAFLVSNQEILKYHFL